MREAQGAKEMTDERRARLEAAGFRIGTAADFLGMTPEQGADDVTPEEMLAILAATSTPQEMIERLIGPQKENHDA